MAITETRGMDAISPPIRVFFLAISETITMIPDESRSLITVCSI
jgi:hypothetical protein